MSVAEYPMCPRCKQPVRAKSERHELRLQLVNAAEGAPKEHTDYHDVFHHRCAQHVWNAVRDQWYGASNQESSRTDA